MRDGLESLLDFLENPGEGVVRTLAFTVLALGMMAGGLGLAALAVLAFGWYVLAAAGAGTALVVVYLAGASHGRQT